MAGETDDRFLAVLREPEPVFDLDIKGVHPGAHACLDRLNLVVMDPQLLDWLTIFILRSDVAADRSGRKPDTACDIFVDQEPVRKENVGLVVVELIA